MGIRFAKRAAARIMKRGESAIRLNPLKMEDIEKALTNEDIRRLVANGSIYAVKAKHNLSLGAKKLKVARSEGRRRGIGRRRGTTKARQGRSWEKKVRSQRTLLKLLRSSGKIDKRSFNEFYMRVKGNTYSTKATLLSHLKEQGVQVGEEEMKRIKEQMKQQYK